MVYKSCVTLRVNSHNFLVDTLWKRQWFVLRNLKGKDCNICICQKNGIRSIVAMTLNFSFKILLYMLASEVLFTKSWVTGNNILFGCLIFCVGYGSSFVGKPHTTICYKLVYWRTGTIYVYRQCVCSGFVRWCCPVVACIQFFSGRRSSGSRFAWPITRVAGWLVSLNPWFCFFSVTA